MVEVNQACKRLPWRICKIVLPQHADHAGVMWHGSYIPWLEEARIQALQSVGLNYSELAKNGFEMPVISLKVDYLKPLYHGDKVSLESFCLDRHGARWPWKTKFLKNDNSLVAEANIDFVLVRNEDKGFRLVRKIPEEISIGILNLQKGPGF